MSRIFLSYSRADATFMQFLRSKLLAAGHSVWTDEKLSAGTSIWPKIIEEEIERAEFVIAIMSPPAKASEWVYKEIFYALMHRVQIIPVWAIGNEQNSIPFLISTVQRIDMRLAKNREEMVARLLARLEMKTILEEPAMQRHINYVPLVVDELNKLVEIINRIRNILLGFAEKLTTHTEEFQLVSASGNVRAKQSIWTMISGYMLEFGSDIEAELPDLKETWTRVMEYMSRAFADHPIRTAADREQYIIVRNSLELARIPYAELLLPKIREMKLGFTSWKSKSAGISKAVNTIMPAVIDLELIIQIGTAYFGGLLSIADEAIRLYDQSSDA
jgi:hypothetical protein